jgi:hypothetical protein
VRRRGGAGRAAALALLAAALLAPRAGAAEGDAIRPLLRGAAWGAAPDAVARAFGDRATRLARPIDFGDSYADLVLRDWPLGGYPFTVFFQFDKASRGLKRIQIERQRHGANPAVFRAALAGLRDELGAPAQRCGWRGRAAHGGQDAAEWRWRVDGNLVRAVFRDTTLEASEGCLSNDPASVGSCGLTGQLFVRIAPAGPEAGGCG